MGVINIFKVTERNYKRTWSKDVSKNYMTYTAGHSSNYKIDEHMIKMEERAPLRVLMGQSSGRNLRSRCVDNISHDVRGLRKSERREPVANKTEWRNRVGCIILGLANPYHSRSKLLFTDCKQ